MRDTVSAIVEFGICERSTATAQRRTFRRPLRLCFEQVVNALVAWIIRSSPIEGFEHLPALWLVHDRERVRGCIGILRGCRNEERQTRGHPLYVTPVETAAIEENRSLLPAPLEG